MYIIDLGISEDKILDVCNYVTAPPIGVDDAENSNFATRWHFLIVFGSFRSFFIKNTLCI